MKINEGTSVAVVVNREWANLRGVRLFLRQNQNPEKEIHGVDESHIILARLINSEDPQGLWIELKPPMSKEDPTAHRYHFFIPWSQVFAVVVAEEFPLAIQEEVGKESSTGYL